MPTESSYSVGMAHLATTDLTPAEVTKFHSLTRMGGWGCIEWIGIRNRGYGRIQIGGVSLLVHRVAWSMANGAIPDGLVIDHLCCNKACVNPEHLDAVTDSVNSSRHLLGTPGWVDVAHMRRVRAEEAHLYTATGRRRKVA